MVAYGTPDARSSIEHVASRKPNPDEYSAKFENGERQSKGVSGFLKNRRIRLKAIEIHSAWSGNSSTGDSEGHSLIPRRNDQKGQKNWQVTDISYRPDADTPVRAFRR
jgi:hypothetical protein